MVGSIWQGIKTAVWHTARVADVGVGAAKSVTGTAKNVLPGAMSALGKFLSNPTYLKASAVTGLGVYGFATGETGMERVERAIGFGGLGAFALNKSNWTRLANTGGFIAAEKVESIGAKSKFSRYLTNKKLRAKAIANGHIFSPAGLIAGAGMTYGLINQDMNVLEGAAFAGLGYLGYKAFPRSSKVRDLLGLRSGLTVGTIWGATSAIRKDENPFAGAAKGAAVGTLAGGAVHALAMGYNSPVAARFLPQMISAHEARVGALGAGLIGLGAAQLVQPPNPNRNLEADGVLALGLHTLRHG